MKKYLHFVIHLFLSFSVFAVTELEVLWQQAKDFSYEIISSKASQEFALNSLKYKSHLYPMSFNSKINSSFSDVYSDVTWCTTSSNLEFSFVKQNPAGNNISLSLNYGMNRDVLNYFAEVDVENIGYAQIPSVTLLVSQSLNPFFLQGIKFDPNIQILHENIKLAKYEEQQIEQSIMENITHNYIQFRCLSRLLNKTYEYLKFYEKYTTLIEEKISKGIEAGSSLWDVENTHWECFEDYIEYTNSRENVLLILQNYCKEINSISENSLLPKIEKGLYDYNPFEQAIISRINKENYQHILNNQAHSPVLSFLGTFAETLQTKDSLLVNYIEDKSSFDWSFSVGISFDEFFSPAKKLRNDLHKNNLALYSSELRVFKTQFNNQKNNCDFMIESYKKQINNTEKILQNRKESVDNFEQLFSSGKCSKMDLDESKLQFLNIKCIYENLKDSLWFYTWKRMLYK